MAELTEAVAEVAEGVAADALQVAEVSRSLSGRDLSIGFFIGASFSGLGTFWWTRRWLERKYSQIAEDEIAAMRRHYWEKREASRQRDEKPELEMLIEERGYRPPPPGGLNVSAKELMMDLDEAEAAGKVDIDELVTRVYGDWDYEVEIPTRTPDHPYVIHKDEYSDKDYPGVTLTYYEGDDVLCDEDSKLIDNKDQLVGENNLGKFGHGSGNPNIVYVRNEPLSVDIELVKNKGKYSEEVLGFKHSDRRSRKRRRSVEEET